MHPASSPAVERKRSGDLSLLLPCVSSANRGSLLPPGLGVRGLDAGRNSHRCTAGFIPRSAGTKSFTSTEDRQCPRRRPFSSFSSRPGTPSLIIHNGAGPVWIRTRARSEEGGGSP